MRYLGIDFGEKHIGTAVSNEDGTMAFPHTGLSNDSNLLNNIEAIVDEKKVEEIIIGESKDFSGKENAVMAKARIFAKNLEQTLGLPIHFEPEFMTSVEARHIQGGSEKTHSSAAALILKSYLDRKAEEDKEKKKAI